MHSDGVNRKLQKDKMDAGCRNTTCIFFVLYINNWSGGSILIYANNEAKSMPACDLGDCRDNE